MSELLAWELRWIDGHSGLYPSPFDKDKVKRNIERRYAMSELRIKVTEWFAEGWDVMEVITLATSHGMALGLSDAEILECVIDSVEGKVGKRH